MIRTEDVSIHDPEAKTIREKKISDLKNRVEAVNATQGAVLVSIHQNILPFSPEVRGAQVFYGRIPGSETLGEAVQLTLNRSVNGAHEKKDRPIDASIYLMKHVDCPAILVECGFLSNPEEALLLEEDSHQKLLAAAIASGLLPEQGITEEVAENEE